MPTYEYKHTVTGEIIEIVMTIAEMQEKQDKDGYLILPDGVAGKRYYRAPMTRKDSTWPMESYAAGCNPDEVKEQRDHSVKIGVPTDFNPKTGDAIFTSPQHRKRYCEAVGLFDRNAGPSDPVPKEYKGKGFTRR